MGVNRIKFVTVIITIAISVIMGATPHNYAAPRIVQRPILHKTKDTTAATIMAT